MFAYSQVARENFPSAINGNKNYRNTGAFLNGIFTPIPQKKKKKKIMFPGQLMTVYFHAVSIVTFFFLVLFLSADAIIADSCRANH